MTLTLPTLTGQWQSVAGAWLAEVQQRTGSDRTPREYVHTLERFLAEIKPPEATTAHVHAFAYGPGPSGKEPSPSTVVVRLAAISSFYDFARRMGLATINPATEVKRPKLRQPTPSGLDGGALRRLLKAIPNTPAGIRDRAIVLTMVLSGLRRQEVMNLRAGDLTQDGNKVFYNVRAKGGVERHRELPAPAFAAITAALEAQGRPLATLAPGDRLFDVSHWGFGQNLARYGKKAKLGHVTPHALRHSAAKLRRETGASIEDVGALLGHRSIATTARYLARLEGEQDHGWQGVAEMLGLG